MKTIFKSFLIFACPFLLFAQIPHLPTPIDDMANPAVYRQGYSVYSGAQRALIEGDFVGFQGGIGMYGACGLLQKNWAIEKDVHNALDINFYWIPRDEFGYLMQRSNRTLARDNALIIPIFWSLRKNIYREMLDSELIPYIEGGVGPLIGVRFPATYGF